MTAMHINLDEEDSKSYRNMNQRISADLRARAQNSHQEDPDFAEDSEYIKDTKKTGRFTWVWIVLIILAILSLICIIFI